MNLIQKINKVVDFHYLNNQHIFIFRKSGLYQNNNLIRPLNSFWASRRFKKYLLFQTENGGSLEIYDIERDQLISLDGSFHLNLYQEKGDSFLIKISPGNYAEINSKLEIIREESNGRFPKTLVNGVFFSFQKGILFKIELTDITKQNLLTDFNERVQGNNLSLHSETFFYNQKLFLHVTDMQQTAKTFCLDTNTGNVLFETEKIGPWFQLIDDKIYAVSKNNNGIAIMDPSTFTIQSIDFSDQCTKDAIMFDKKLFTVVGNTLYFTQNLGTNQAVTGSINIDEQKITWTHKFGKENGRISEIKAKEDRLFVLTEDHTLHIFQKSQ